MGSKFPAKCFGDLKRPWQVAVVVLSVTAIVLYNHRVSEAGKEIGFRNWLDAYGDFWILIHAFFLFCIVLGASGLGEEMAGRTIRLWLLRPQSRDHFLFVSEGVGIAAILFLYLIPLAFLEAIRFRWGQAPFELFRSPLPLILNSWLVGVTVFAVSRSLMLLLQNARWTMATVLGVMVGMVAIEGKIPRPVSRFLPDFEELLEPGLILKSWKHPYPVAQTCVIVAILIAAYGLELWRFRRAEIRV
jgi:hypothetical protein